MVAEELADKLHIRSFAAAGASAREFKQRCGELAVLDVCGNVNEVLLGSNVLYAVVPVVLHFKLGFERLHFESLHALLAGTYVNAVAAAKTVEHVDSLNKAHAFECRTERGNRACFAEGSSLYLCLVENERTDRSVRTYICTLVALYTVLFEPFGHESCHTAFLVCSCTLLPGSVRNILEVGNLKQVTVLCVDRTYYLVDEGRIVIACLGIIGKLCPCGVNGKLVVFATTVYSLIVLVNDILAFLSVALDDEFLHLLDSKIHRYHFGDTEESALENGVGTVAKTYFLSYLGSVDVVDSDIVFGEITLDMVGKVLCKFFAVPYGVEQECAAVTQTTGNVVHIEVSLNVACHEVRGVYQICGTDRTVTETKVRAGETARLLGVVCEICLAVLIGIVADNLDRVLVCANGAVCTKTVELGFVGGGITQCHFSYHRQRSEGNIVFYAEGKVILGHRKGEVVEHRHNL